MKIKIATAEDVARAGLKDELFARTLVIKGKPKAEVEVQPIIEAAVRQALVDIHQAIRKSFTEVSVTWEI